MKAIAKPLQLLILLECLILASGYFIFSGAGIGIKTGEVALLSSAFMLITLSAMVVFFRGRPKDPATQTMHSLVAVTLKFLLELILAVVWFFVAKKTALSSVILFFVLYLAFTMFSILVMVKTLKNKAL
jgi:hypothetical protein